MLPYTSAEVTWAVAEGTKPSIISRFQTQGLEWVISPARTEASSAITGPRRLMNYTYMVSKEWKSQHRYPFVTGLHKRNYMVINFTSVIKSE